MNVIRIIPNQLETKLEQISPSETNGQFTSDTERDVLKWCLSNAIKAYLKWG